MVGCPVADEKGDEFKKEVLIAFEDLLYFKKINGEPFSPEDRSEALALKEERIREAMGKPPVEENEG